MIRSSVKQTNLITDESEINFLWELYEKAFANDKVTAQEQMCYDKTSFQDSLKDKDYWKFILYQNDDIIGLSLVTNNLVKASVSYCNIKTFSSKYKGYLDENLLYYITCIFINPEYKAKIFVNPLIKKICEFIYEKKAMVGFDYSKEKNEALPKLIERVANRLGPVEENILDKQVYMTMKFS